MKDQFLYRLRREPAQELVESVYRDIAPHAGNEPVAQKNWQSAAAQPEVKLRRRRVIALTALAAIVLFIITSIASPAARAIVDDIVRQIGGQLVRETAIYPMTDDSPLIEPAEYLTLEEARRAVSFEFDLPTALPERYELIEEVIVTPGFNSVWIRWHGTETRGDGVSLYVSPTQPGVEYVAGSESVEQIEVNGTEAMFIRGGWLENTESWDPDISRDVRWAHDGLNYQLSTGGQFSCPDEPEWRCPLSDEELIRIAESVQP